MSSSSTTAVLPISQRTFAVSSHLLLALYGIVPLSIALALADRAFLGGALRGVLPDNPATLLWWTVVFNYPHIVSSLITLADDEYIAFYKRRFAKALTVIALLVLGTNVAIPLLFPGVIAIVTTSLLAAFFSAYTMLHLFSQQFGIGMMLMKVVPTRSYEVWRGFATAASTAMYGIVFIDWPENSISARFTYEALTVLAGVFSALTVVQGIYIARASKRTLGTAYVYANLVMVVATYVLLQMGYGFFVVAIPRFLHDVTAFVVYSAHDQNRNSDVRRNYFYRWLRFLPIPVLFLTPLLAVAVAHTIQCGSFYVDILLGFDQAAVDVNECPLDRFYQPTGLDNGISPSMQLWTQIMLICGLFHYHIESFVWRREAIHRHSVSFT